MVAVIVLVSAFFTLSRFAAPGHTVGPWGTWEAMAHVWMGVLLVLFLQALPRIGNNPIVGPGGKEAFPWTLLACWLVPSLVELALFLVGPFNPF